MTWKEDIIVAIVLFLLSFLIGWLQSSKVEFKDEGKKDKYEMWFKSESRGKFVHITYAAVRNEKGEFEGVLEYVQDIKPYRDIDTDLNREL